jgi:uncharacterized protein
MAANVAVLRLAVGFLRRLDVVVSAGGHWIEVAGHWPIALTMAFGSFVAGSTPMGGGTVGFPVLVLLFGQEATMGRDFSFAVQSIGMTSASIFILCRRLPVETTMLRWALLGSTVSTPLGILFFAPLVPGLVIKLLFAVVWASFGIMTLYKIREFSAAKGIARASKRFDRLSGLAVGLFGGAFVASVTGVGVDMLIYTVLVLVRHADLKVAIPTSVIMMAHTSLIGVATKSLTTGFSPGVFGNWLAAAPVVALGAPLGAYFVHLVGRQRIWCSSPSCAWCNSSGRIIKNGSSLASSACWPASPVCWSSTHCSITCTA